MDGQFLGQLAGTLGCCRTVGFLECRAQFLPARVTAGIGTLDCRLLAVALKALEVAIGLRHRIADLARRRRRVQAQASLLIKFCQTLRLHAQVAGIGNPSGDGRTIGVLRCPSLAECWQRKRQQ